MADYLLFEAPMGYSVFKVVHQADTVGNRLTEVQEGVQDLAKFGKMVELVSFLPFQYVFEARLQFHFAYISKEQQTSPRRNKLHLGRKCI